MISFRRFRLGAVLAVLGFASAPLAAQDVILSSTFEPPFPEQPEAVRFLNQATFGATPADAARLRQLGIGGWLDEQFARSPSGHRRPLEQLALTLPASTQINSSDRLRQWYRVALTGQDQLRQRVGFALSQIVVASDVGDALSQEPLLVADWTDLLTRNAFGNYRTLLQETTRHPAMGRYLTHYRNRKIEVSGTPQMATVTPDENYAREVMQLFSIGLFERELDYSPILVGGNPVATYDNNMIGALARVFTGLAHECTATAEPFPGAGFQIVRDCGAGCTGTDCRFTNTPMLFFNAPPSDRTAAALIPDTTPIDRGLRHPDFFRPLVCYPRYHDSGRQAVGNSPIGTTPLPWTGVAPQPAANKLLTLGGEPILTIEPIVSTPQTAPNRALNCHDTGNLISPAHRSACLAYCENNINSAIDLLFQHPNTSSFVARQLIQRLVTSNPTPAYIHRVACAFEGTSAQPGQCSPGSANPRGDMRAVISAVLLDRDARELGSLALNAGKAREPILKLTQLWRAFDAVVPAAGDRNFGPASPQGAYAQRPLGSPSVFNFFEPDFKQAGRLSSVNLNGDPSTEGLFAPEFQVLNEVTVIDTANDLYSRICAGYGGGSCSGAFAATPPTNAVYIPPASLDALPLDGSAAGDAALVERLNTLLMGGAMSGTINTLAACPTPGPPPTLTAVLGSGMKGRLYGMLRCTAFSSLNANQNDRRSKALYLTHLIALSPEYNTQR